MLSHVYKGLAFFGDNRAESFRLGVCQFILENKSEMLSETHDHMASRPGVKFVTQYAKAMQAKYFRCDELFLHCAARFLNQHIRVFFKDSVWTTVFSGHEAYVSVNLAAVGVDSFALLKPETDDLTLDKVIGTIVYKSDVPSEDVGSTCVSSDVESRNTDDCDAGEQVCDASMHSSDCEDSEQVCEEGNSAAVSELVSRSSVYPNKKFHGVRKLVVELEKCAKSVLYPGHMFKSDRFCLLRIQKYSKSLLFPERVFCSESQLLKRVVKKTKAKKFKCATCSKGLDTRGQVKYHCEVDHGQFPCRETYCPSMFKSKGARTQHEHVHDRKSRTCVTCGCVFEHRFALRRHVVLHSISRPHRCKQCKLQYKRKQDLAEHVRTKHKSKMFHCSQCSFSHTSVRQVKQHAFSHTPKSLVCDKCGDWFTFPSQMSKHSKSCM